MLPTFGERHDERIYLPRPAVYAVIRDDAGCIALVREAGYLFLPGGGIETAEELEAALIREVREECCRSILIHRRIGEALQYFSAGDRHYASHAVYFAADFAGMLAGEPEHELVWLEPGAAATAVAREAHRWAITLASLPDNS